jgi:hypothetical protein
VIRRSAQAVKFIACADLQHLALKQHHHAIGDTKGGTHVVRNHHRRHTQSLTSEMSEFVIAATVTGSSPSRRFIVEQISGSIAVARAKPPRFFCRRTVATASYIAMRQHATCSSFIVTMMSITASSMSLCSFSGPSATFSALRHRIEQRTGLKQNAEPPTNLDSVAIHP